MSQYIIFEGIDGSGKSTLIKILNKYLKDVCNKRQIELSNLVTFTKEPGNNEYGYKLRQWLNKEIILSDQEVLKLFADDRQYNYDHFVIPSISNGKSVIQDRSFITTMAYQPFTHQEIFNAMKSSIGSSIVPTTIIYLKYELGNFISRMESSDDNKNDMFYISEEVYNILTSRYNSALNAIRTGKFPLYKIPTIIELENNDSIDDIFNRLLEVIDINELLR